MRKLLLVAVSGALLLLPQTQDSTPPPIQFFIQDQNRWSCVLKGGDVVSGRLPAAIECSHSRTGEVVIYLPQVKKQAPKEEKK